MSAVLSVAGLEVDLGGSSVLRGVDLALGEGQWITVIGPNGAGKTTLLRAVLGAVAYRGTIEIAGSAARDPIARARAIAYVPQTPVIPPGVRVIDYVLLGRTPHRGVFGADSPADVELAGSVLVRLDLSDLADREVVSLSGGERQRAVLARALVQEPSILLLDEPTTALDLGHQQGVLDLVEELRRERGLSVLATLHDLTLAARYGDELAVLAAGEIVESGPPAVVLSERLIAAHFNANVRIIEDVDGPVIVPVVAKSSEEQP